MLKKRIITSACRGRVFPAICLLTCSLILCVVILNKEESSHIKVNHTTLGGHVLTLSYTGQQMAGVRGLISQQSWVKAFNLSMAIVTPFFNQSHLMHSKQLWVNSVKLSERRQKIDLLSGLSTFGKYFDEEYFNERSQEVDRPQLVAWNDFLETGAKSLIVLNIQDIFVKGCLSYVDKGMCKSDRSLEGFRQFTSGCSVSQSTLSSIEYLKSIGFKVVRRVCLNCQFQMDLSPTPSQIVLHIFDTYNPNEVTLLINQWKFSIVMTPNCTSDHLRCQINALKTDILPSKSILLDVKEYIDKFYFSTLTSSPPKFIVAIMIRIEWLLIFKKGADLYNIEDCLNSISARYNSLVTSQAVETLPLLGLDIGKFGSDSFSSTLRINSISAEYFEEVIALVKDFVSKIYNGSLTFEQWEQTFSDTSTVTHDGGYVATVQSTMASSSDCLILIGGGHFQQMAKKLYLYGHNGDTSCLFHMCL